MVREPRMKQVLRLQAAISSAVREYLDSEGFIEVVPPIIGPVTDPGIRGAKQVTIDYYGHEYKVMSSAILYKQMLASSLDKIYFFSPNIRLEPPETSTTGRHLVEFIQVDLEEAGATYLDAMARAEGLVAHVCEVMDNGRAPQLRELGRKPPVATKPFRRLTHKEAVDMLLKGGHDASPAKEIPWESEEKLSQMFHQPFFIHDYPRGSRGFYDKEDPDRPGILRDFDLLYPEGYGEAASGAEREYEYDKVIMRLRATGENPSKYGWYLEMLREGIQPSSGFGIGLERLTRFICGLENVWEARPYPKVAGILSP